MSSKAWDRRKRLREVDDDLTKTRRNERPDE
jgi:hypothetical protein